MNSKSSLPIILVSASDREIAEEFISELIDGDVQDESASSEAVGRVWRLQNKYYHAEVLVQACGDSDPPPSSCDVEAHVLYLTPEECDGGLVTAKMRGCSSAAVRVLALRTTHVPTELDAWATRVRYEPVPLLANPPTPSNEPFAEEVGLARVRAALHAHPWPGLRRLDRAAPLYAERDETSSSGGEGDGDSDAEEDVERAEQFARALGALGDMAGGAAGGDAERRERAEQLVAAFCRALGHSLDSC